MGDKAVISELRAQIAALEKDAASFQIAKDAESVHVDAYDDGAYEGETGDKGVQSAFKKIVSLVNARERSELSVRERLARLGYDECEADEAIRRAKEYGFIDDKRYADVLIRSRIAQGRGSAGIERELSSNNIDPYTVEGWPHEYVAGEDVEVSRAIEFMRRHPTTSKNKRDGAYRKLVQKGYSSSVASTAARIWLETR